MKKTEEQLSVEYQTYIEERRSLINATVSSAEQFDKYILTLAGGALGLSLSFIKNIAPTIVPNTAIYLTISWSCLIISMLSTLISFLTSQQACETQIEILENKYFPDECHKTIKNSMAKVTTWLNKASILFFILGVAFLSIFSIININQTKGDYSMKKVKIQDGYVPPTTPKQPQMSKKGYTPPPPPQKPANNNNSGD